MNNRPMLFPLLLSLAACTSGTAVTVQKLPSGKDLKLLGMGKIEFKESGPALMLKYQTELSIDQKDKMRQEVEEIWPVFRVDVEKAGLSSAIISANTPNKGVAFISTNQSYNFVAKQRSNRTWDLSSWGRDYEAEIDGPAADFMRRLQGGQWLEATRMFWFPEDFTAAELQEDLRGISGSLQIFSDEFGAIRSYAAADEDKKSVSIFLHTATAKYWARHPHLIGRLYDVEFANVGPGSIFLLFSLINDKLVLSRIGYGLPADHVQSKLALMRIGQRVQALGGEGGT